MTIGFKLIIAERKRQIESEGYTAEHDSQYKCDELFIAGCCYHSAQRFRENSLVDSETLPLSWPFLRSVWKPSPDNRVKELTKAGALLQAHVDLSGSELATQMVEICAKEIDELLKLKEL